MATDGTNLISLLEALLAPHRPGDELFPGVRWLSSSSEAGLRLALDVRGSVLHVELAPVDAVQRFAARSAHFAVSYRTGTGSAGRPLSDAEGMALCRALVPLLQRHEAEVLRTLRERAAAARSETEGQARIRHIEGGPLLSPAQWRAQRYYTLSHYVGCLIGCRFCYAQGPVGLVRHLEGSPEVRWGSYVDARRDAPTRLAEEFATLPPGPVKFSPIVSDPYQAIERKLELTRACLQAFVDHGAGFPPLLLTRSKLIARDVDLLAAIPDAYAGVSLTTVDDAVRQHFEPRAATVPERLQTLATLRAAGVHAFAIVQPQWPGPLDALADAIAANATSANLGVLESIEDAGPLLDAPGMVQARDRSWQAERKAALRQALLDRGVEVWDGELPPALCTSPDA